MTKIIQAITPLAKSAGKGFSQEIRRATIVALRLIVTIALVVGVLLIANTLVQGIEFAFFTMINSFGW